MIDSDIALLATLTDRLDQRPAQEDLAEDDPVAALVSDLQDQPEVPAPEIQRPTSLSPTALHLVDPGNITERRFRLKRLSQVIQAPDPDWLIEGLMRAACLAVLYGAPQTFKTFLALAWTLCVATGRDWMGRPVKQGRAVYICAEGQAGLKRRAKAWLKAFGAAGEVYVLDEAASLSAPDVVAALIADIRGYLVEAGVDDDPLLVVVDTLARCFEGDENTAKDMSRFIQGIDEIKRAFACTVLVVHHEPYQGDRPRGSSALWGAVDTSFRLHRPSDQSSLVILTNMKQKEDALLPDIVLDAVPVNLDDGGSSLVLVKAEGTVPTPSGPAAAARSSAKLRATQHAILDAVSGLGVDGATVKELEARTKISNTTLHRHLATLVGANELIQERGQKETLRFWVALEPLPADD